MWCDSSRQASLFLFVIALLAVITVLAAICFHCTDTVWPLIFQIVNGVNGPISTTISMTMEFICWLFFIFHIHTLCVIAFCFISHFRPFITFDLRYSEEEKKCDSADLGLINNKMKGMWNYQIYTNSIETTETDSSQ